jgi:hypothetical protein
MINNFLLSQKAGIIMKKSKLIPYFILFFPVFFYLSMSGVYPQNFIVSAETYPVEKAGFYGQGTHESSGFTTYYIRPDGGNAHQCNGTADAPYPGSGEGMSCAWDHPFQALPPDGAPRMSGGDTLIIGSGDYRMGYGAAGADNCVTDWPWECHMPPVPSGPDPDSPTRIHGNGWNAGCPNAPELWGAERADMVLNLRGSNNVLIACLEITDHEGCVESHSGGLACNRGESYPYGNWAAFGISAEDSENVILRDLNIHGLAYSGIYAGRLRDWTLENVRIAANGWVGWDGDIGENSANSGNMIFRNWTVEWNGCAETWPEGEPAGCWGQSAGGYGDGVGTYHTGGDWIIEDSVFRYNTSDGLDLLYHSLEGDIIIRRTASYGNAGDQIKTNGSAYVENTIAVSNCGFFADKPFTHHVDHCRAGGSALAFGIESGQRLTVVNSTVTGQGDCLVIAECAQGQNCNNNDRILLQNNIFLGHLEFIDPGDTTCLAWTDLDYDPFDFDHSILYGAKNIPDPCPVDSICHIAPGLVDESITNFNASLTTGSPAIDAGRADGAPAHDFSGNFRDIRPDIGAYEWINAFGKKHTLPGVLMLLLDR